MFKGWSFCLFHSNLYISMFFFFFCLSVIHRSDGRMMTKVTLVFFLTLVEMFLVNFTKHDIGFWTKMEIFCHDKEVSVYSHCFVLFFNIRNGCWICQMTCQHPPWWVMVSMFGSLYMTQCIHIHPEIEPSLHFGKTVLAWLRCVAYLRCCWVLVC